MNRKTWNELIFDSFRKRGAKRVKYRRHKQLAR